MSQHKFLMATLGIWFASASTVMAGPAYLDTIDPSNRRATIGTVRAEAHVKVSDGLEYDVVTLFHDHQRAIFHRAYADRKVTLGVEGKYVWSFDGERETEGLPVYEDIVLGHQFHAQILFFDELHGPLNDPVEAECGDARRLVLSGPDGRSLRVDRKTSRPLGLVFTRESEPDIEITFDRWRVVDGIDLPFLVTIDDGERVFYYEYGSVRFDEGSMDEFRAPMSVLTDEQQLLRRHRIAMDAHLLGDARMMKGLFADGTVLSEGEIYRPTGADADAMMARIMSNRDYTRYDDLVRPIVRVSGDGSLGWVIVQIAAEGVRFDENGSVSGPLEFTCAWISMFEKIDGEWMQIGNVSNFKPDRK